MQSRKQLEQGGSDGEAAESFLGRGRCIAAQRTNLFCRAKKWRFRDLIRPIPAARPTAGAAQGRKSLSSGRTQAILALDGRPLSECQVRRSSRQRTLYLANVGSSCNHCTAEHEVNELVAGFVYVMTNDAFPHLVKIGKSSKDPRQDRVNELNHTGFDEPLRGSYYSFVEDGSSIERWLHGYFEKHRPNKAREFFQIGVAEAIVAVRDAAYLRGGIKYEEVFYVSLRELEEGKRKQEQAKLREEQQRAEQRAAEEGRRQELERVAAEELRRHAAAAEQAQHERATKTIPIIFPILLLFLLPIPT